MLLSRRAAGLLLLLFVPVILGGLTTSGCKAGIQVTVEPDPRVFTLFAGLLAAGYSSRDGTSLNPTQQAVWDALEELDPATRAGFASLLANQIGEAAPEFGLTGRILDAGPPPKFDGLESTPMQGCLQHLWANHAQALYRDTLQAHTAMAESLASAKDTVRQVLAYARVKTVPFDSLRVVPNPLACPGFSYRWLPPSWPEPKPPTCIVLGPGDGDLTRTLARETFRLCLDSTVFRDLEEAGAFDSLKRVFEMSRAYPFGQDRCGYLSDFVEENLARACTLRVFPPPAAEMATALADQWDAGFVLVEGFYNALTDFESSERSLSESVGELVSTLDTGAVLNRTLPTPSGVVAPPTAVAGRHPIWVVPLIKVKEGEYGEGPISCVLPPGWRLTPPVIHISAGQTAEMLAPYPPDPTLWVIWRVGNEADDPLWAVLCEKYWVLEGGD